MLPRAASNLEWMILNGGTCDHRDEVRTELSPDGRHLFFRAVPDVNHHSVRADARTKLLQDDALFSKSCTSGFQRFHHLHELQICVLHKRKVKKGRVEGIRQGSSDTGIHSRHRKLDDWRVAGTVDPYSTGHVPKGGESIVHHHCNIGKEITPIRLRTVIGTRIQKGPGACRTAASPRQPCNETTLRAGNPRMPLEYDDRQENTVDDCVPTVARAGR